MNLPEGSVYITEPGAEWLPGQRLGILGLEISIDLPGRVGKGDRGQALQADQTRPLQAVGLRGISVRQHHGPGGRGRGAAGRPHQSVPPAGRVGLTLLHHRDSRGKTPCIAELPAGVQKLAGIAQARIARVFLSPFYDKVIPVRRAGYTVRNVLGALGSCWSPASWLPRPTAA